MRYLAFALSSLAALALVTACVGDDPAPSASTADAGGGDATTTPPPPPTGTDAGSCANTVCGGACVDTKTSKDHCGACNHACGGGDCNAGVCAPVAVATNITEPLGVAVAATSALWYRNGAVEKCPVTGCTGAPVSITTQSVTITSPPGGTSIVTDGSRVTWIAGSNVFACDVAGCQNGFPPTTGSGLTDVPTQLAVEGSTLFVSQSTGTQRSGPMGSLALAGMAGTGSDVPTGIAANATHVFFAGVKQSAAGVDRCERAGCASATRLFTDAKYIAVGGGQLVATSSAGIVACAVGGCGGTPTVLAPDDKTATSIAANDAFVAWSVGTNAAPDGTIRVCALPDCKGGPRTIAQALPWPGGVTIADGFVYWANRGLAALPGSIWRAKL